MIKTISQLKREFIDSGDKTAEFKSFCRMFKFEFKKVLDELGCTDLECSYGHFIISGFFNSADGRLWYFSLNDVRDMKYERELRLLVRTAKHHKDYTGGMNRFALLDDITDDLKRIIGEAP